MSRSPVSVRVVRESDAADLLELWAGLPRRHASIEDALVEVGTAISRVLERSDERIMVAEYGGHFAGAVHLKLSRLSPLSTECSVQAGHLTVAPDFRRHGIGKLLLDSAVVWAEELGIPNIVAVSTAASRDANRFMARLGLGQMWVVRVGSTAHVRSKLPFESPALRRQQGSNRQLGQVLAARRSQRRQQQTTP